MSRGMHTISASSHDCVRIRLSKASAMQLNSIGHKHAMSYPSVATHIICSDKSDIDPLREAPRQTEHPNSADVAQPILFDDGVHKREIHLGYLSLCKIERMS